MTNPGGPLPGAVKVGYGAGSLGISAAEFFVRVYLLKLYSDTLGLSPILAGAVLAVGLIWDAVTDPLIGALSDHTRARSGRRRPWMLAGSLLAAATFVVLFLPPHLESSPLLALYLLVTYIAFSTSLTLLAVPHAALGGELSSDPKTRNEIFGWRFLFSNVGLVAGIVIPVMFAGEARGAGSGAPGLAVMIAAAGLVAIRATRGRDAPDTSGERVSIREVFASFRVVLRRGPFRPLFGAYLLGSVALTINSSLALFYYEHRLGLGEQEVFLAILLPFSLVIALSIGAWILVTRRIGKRLAAFLGVTLLGVGGAIVYPLLPAGSLVGPVLWELVGGGLVGSVFLLDATVADVVDWDEAVRGVHREGLYFGFWRMGSKAARALGLIGSGLLLDLVGFDPDAAVQSAETAFGLAIAFGPGVGVFFVLAAVVWLCMPLDEKIQKRVRRVLARRAKAGKTD